MSLLTKLEAWLLKRSAIHKKLLRAFYDKSQELAAIKKELK